MRKNMWNFLFLLILLSLTSCVGTLESESSDLWISRSIDPCEISLEIPRGWKLQEIDYKYVSDDSSTQFSSQQCTEYTLTSPSGDQVLTLKPNDETKGEAYKPCPSGTVIIKYLTSRAFITRFLDPITNEYIYSETIILVNSVNELEEMACKTPWAVSLGDFSVEITFSKANSRYDQQNDLNIADRIVSSIESQQ